MSNTANPEYSQLPNDLGAERTLLGAILLNNDCYQEAAAAHLHPEEFYLDSHRTIFKALAVLGEAGKEIDTITLLDAIEKLPGGAAGVGGVAYLSSLIDGVPHQPTVIRYVDIVRDMSRRRKFIHSMNTGLAAAFDKSETTRDCISIISDKMMALEGDDERKLGQTIKGFNEPHLRELSVMAKKEKEILGLTFGIPELDAATTGLRTGELCVIGGYTGAGKSSIAIESIYSNAVQGSAVALFTLEMTKEQVLNRILSRATDIPSYKFRNPKMFTGHDWDVIWHNRPIIDRLPIVVDDAELDITEIKARFRLYIKRHNIKMGVVDTLQLIEVKDEKNKFEKVSRAIRELRILAKNTGVPIMVLAQLTKPQNREEANPRPNKYNLRDSGDIEQAAHLILMPYRPMDEAGKVFTGEDEILIEKQREGIIGPIPARYDVTTLTYRSRNWKREPESTKQAEMGYGAQ